MQNNMKKMIFILFAAAALAGCEEPEGKLIGGPVLPELQYVFTRSYVMGYFDPTGVELKGAVANPPMPIYLIGIYLTKGDFIGTYLDEGEKKAAYDALCEEHGDMTFNNYNRVIDDPENPGIRAYPGVDVVSIDLVSDADFDERRPAGASLNNIVEFSAFAVKSWIDNGYTNEGLDHKSTSIYQVCTALSEFSAGDFLLIGDADMQWNDRAMRLGALRLYLDPTLSKSHNFTVTVTMSDGRIFSDTVHMDFE